MKKTNKMLAFVLGISAATLAIAQKNVSDPTYSSHNYKHPNKAAKAKAIEEAKPTLNLREVKSAEQKPDNSLSASANYKGISAEKANYKQFVVSDAPEAIPFIIEPRNANYKQQFPSRTKKIEVPVKTEERDVVVSAKE